MKAWKNKRGGGGSYNYKLLSIWAWCSIAINVVIAILSGKLGAMTPRGMIILGIMVVLDIYANGSLIFSQYHGHKKQSTSLIFVCEYIMLIAATGVLLYYLINEEEIVVSIIIVAALIIEIAIAFLIPYRWKIINWIRRKIKKKKP